MCSHRSLILVVILAGRAADAFAQDVAEFPLRVPGSSHPYGITAGPDGNLWFAEYEFVAGISKIVRMTPTGAITEFPQVLDTNFITAGPDGNLWFTADDLGFSLTAAIGRMTPAGVLTSFPVTGEDLGDIAFGTDGNAWFTWSSGRNPIMGISRITPAGILTEYFLPTLESSPAGIAAGPDGSIWFAIPGEHKIGRITNTGDVSEFALPVESVPMGIVAGPDGNLWFTEQGRNNIGRITPGGVVTEFTIPTPGSEPTFIAAGLDGNLWFTERRFNKVGRITTAGIINEFPVPTPDSAPYDITPGPDGAIWFTENRGGKIGRITLADGPAIESRILPVVGSTAGVGGSFFRTSVQLHNSTAAPTTGRIVFHPSGLLGSDSDPTLSYSLSPGQTQSIADLLPAMGRSGLGSADIEVTSGGVPAATVRVFNDAGEQGTMGFTEEPIRAEDALRPEVSGALLIPADPTRFRFNLGVRTLETESTATLTVRDAAGAVLETVSRAFPATFHEQRSAAEFLGLSALPAGGSIGISMSAGSAIFYGATVDNTTGDPSLQIARPAPLR